MKQQSLLNIYEVTLIFFMLRLLLIASALFIGAAQAKGISPYLPLKLSPEVELHIEKHLQGEAHAPPHDGMPNPPSEALSAIEATEARLKMRIQMLETELNSMRRALDRLEGQQDQQR